jgi:hypothetical protein
VPLTYGRTLEQFVRCRGSSHRHRYILGHAARPAEYAVRLTEYEQQAVLGTLLGDASIGYPNKRSRTPRLATNHGGPQEAWSRYKAETLCRLGVRVDVVANPGFGEITVRSVSRCLPALVGVFDLVRPDGGDKRITPAWLDQLGGVGLAWWLCDDGSCSRDTGMSLHTEGYDRESVECAAAWLSTKFGRVSINCGRTCGWYLGLNRDCRDAMRELVYAHIPACMAYKCRVFDRDSRTTSRRRRV